jgi:hypothetical protein
VVKIYASVLEEILVAKVKIIFKIKTYKFTIGARMEVEALLEAVKTVSEVCFHLMILNAGLVHFFNEIEYNWVLDEQNITCKTAFDVLFADNILDGPTVFYLF